MRFAFVLVLFSAYSLLAAEIMPFLDMDEPSAKLQWNLVWQDEFDDTTTIDNNWNAENRVPMHIISSRWRENISVRDGHAVLSNRREKRGGREWTSGSMICKQLFKYGFFEARMKISAASGVNNSFWMYQWNKTDLANAFEIDIVEAQYPNKVRTNIHDRGKSGDPVHKQRGKTYLSPDDLSEDFHIYAVEWDETKLSFYFDGKILRTEKNDVCHQKSHLVLGSAILKWAGEVTASIDGTSMVVDYVRIWEKVK